jgi:hypothetical protein
MLHVTGCSFAHGSKMAMTYDDDRRLTWESCPLPMGIHLFLTPILSWAFQIVAAPAPHAPRYVDRAQRATSFAPRKCPSNSSCNFKEVSTQRLNAIKWMRVAYFQGHATRCCTGARR